MYYINKQIFYVNSRNKINETDSHTDFSYMLNIDPNETFDKVVLLSCSIPKSFYFIQEGENTFILDEDGVQVTITIPAGNYNRNSLGTTLRNQLNVLSPNAWNYSVSYPIINQMCDDGKYIISVTNNTSQPSLIFGKHVAEQLGFERNSTNTFILDSLKSTNVCNLSNETTLYLHSDICQNNEGDNILQEIYSNGDASYSYINFQNPIPKEYSKPMTSDTSNIYRFTLTDEDGNKIDTNGININFTIMLYKVNEIDKMLRGAIKYFTLLSE